MRPESWQFAVLAGNWQSCARTHTGVLQMYRNVAKDREGEVFNLATSVAKSRLQEEGNATRIHNPDEGVGEGD